MSYGEVELKYIVKVNRTITKLNQLNVRDKDENMSLHLSAAVGNTSTVQYLLSVDSNSRSCNTHGEYPPTLAT